MPLVTVCARPAKVATMPDRDDEGRPFLQRWSRRKREFEPADKGAKAGSQEPVRPPTGVAEASEADEERRLQLAKNREEAESIELDSLDAASDYSPFLKDGVPKVLKSAALRVLWRSSPVFANLDGLNDYDADYGDPELIRKFTGSAWKVGKGYFRDDDIPADGADVADAVTPETGPAEADEQQSSDEKDDVAADEQYAVARSDEDLRETDEPEPALDEPDVAQEAVQAETGEQADEDTPRKVPLRARLALDDWGTG